MNGRHTIFDTRRQGAEDSRNISPSPNRTDTSRVDSAFLADRGEKQSLAVHSIGAPKNIVGSAKV